MVSWELISKWHDNANWLFSVVQVIREGVLDESLENIDKKRMN